MYVPTHAPTALACGNMVSAYVLSPSVAGLAGTMPMGRCTAVPCTTVHLLPWLRVSSARCCMETRYHATTAWYTVSVQHHVVPHVVLQRGSHGRGHVAPPDSLRHPHGYLLRSP